MMCWCGCCHHHHGHGVMVMSMLHWCHHHHRHCSCVNVDVALMSLVFRSPVGNWCKDWQLDWTATDRNWTAVASCDQLWSVQLPVAQFAKNQKDQLWTGCLAHDPPIQGHIPYFFHILIYLIEFTRVLSIMITPKMTYNAKSIISWASVDRILWFLGQ